MIVQVWLALFALGVLLVLIQYIQERASVALSILSLAVWIVTAFSALGIDVVQDSGTVHTSEELSAVVIATAFAVYSFLLVLIATFQAIAGDVDEATEQGDSSAVPAAFKSD